MRTSLFASALVSAFMGPSVAEAAYLRYDITGVVTEILMPGLTSVVVGDPWRATIYVDEAASDEFPESASMGKYATSWATMSLGEQPALKFDEFRPYVEVINNDPADFLLFEQYGIADAACVDGFCLNSVILDYYDTLNVALLDDALAGTLGLTIDDFDNLENRRVRRSAFVARFRDTATGRILGLPTGLTVTMVDTIVTPLPSTLWLTATALAAATATSRRWQRAKAADAWFAWRHRTGV